MSGAGDVEEVKALAFYSEVFHQRPTPQIIKTYLGRLNRAQFLSFVCALSAIVHNNGMLVMTPEWQARFAEDFVPALGARKTASLIRSDSRILVHELQLGLLAKYALLYCRDTETIGDFAEVALRLLLGVNELHSQTHNVALAASPRKAFFSIEAQSAVLPNERFAHVVQRYFRFFEWCDSLQETAEDWLPLRSDFPRLLGFTPEEYLTAAFAVLTPFLTIRDVKSLRDHPPSFVRSQFGSSLLHRDALDRFIELYAVSDEDLVTSAREPTFSVADLAEFIEHPLVLIGADVCICPLPSLLEDTVNTRLYFNLFSKYEEQDGPQAAKRFSRFQGHFLEHYAKLLVAMIVGADYTVSGEVRYAAPGGHRKSSDVVAVRNSDGGAVFVEVTKTRFRLDESLFAMDEAAIIKDMDSMIVRKAAQIQRSIDDLHAGLYTLGYPIETIAPVVVTGQGIPGLIYLKYLVDERLKARGILQATNPLVYCDVEELEALALSNPGEIDIISLLVEKAHHAAPLARAQSLKNYLYYFRPDLSRKRTARETTFPEYEHAVQRYIMPTLRDWGLSGDSDPRPDRQ